MARTFDAVSSGGAGVIRFVVCGAGAGALFFDEVWRTILLCPLALLVLGISSSNFTSLVIVKFEDEEPPFPDRTLLSTGACGLGTARELVCGAGGAYELASLIPDARRTRFCCRSCARFSRSSTNFFRCSFIAPPQFCKLDRRTAPAPLTTVGVAPLRVSSFDFREVRPDPRNRLPIPGL